MTQGRSIPWQIRYIFSISVNLYKYFRFAYVENKVNEAAEQGRASFDVEQIVDQLVERILDKRPLPLESDCLLDICIKENDNVFLLQPSYQKISINLLHCSDVIVLCN